MSDERVDELFTGPPESFVERRDALVKELKAADRREKAKQVAALRRPTLAAWAVNRAVRDAPGAFAELREAGDQLRRTMRRAVSGAGAKDLRSATRERRRHVAALTDRAVAILDDAGSDGAAHRDEIAATFDAASADPEAGERVAQGRLSKPEPAPSGFGDLSPLALTGTAEPPAGEAPPAPSGRGAASGDATAEEPEDAAAAEREALLADLREAVSRTRARAREASEQAVAKEQQAERADSAARSAEEEAERARRAAEAAGERAVHLRREAERRREETDHTRETAERRTRELEEVQERLRDAGG